MRFSLSNKAGRIIFFLWVVEVALIAGAVVAGAWFRFQGSPSEWREFLMAAPVPAMLTACFLTLSMSAFGLYHQHSRHSTQDLFLRLLLSFGFGGVSLLVLFYLVPMTYIGRGVLFLSLGLAFCLVFSVRLLLPRVIRTDVFRRRILVLGAGNNASIITTRLRRKTDRSSFVIVGFVPQTGQAVLVPENEVVHVPAGGLQVLTHTLQIHEIVVAPDERRGGIPMEEMLACAQRGVAITDLSTFIEREIGMIKISVADPSWLVFSGGFSHSGPRLMGKRFFDIVAAGVLLLLAWPAMLLTAIAVWMESGGPVLYRQTRVGHGGRDFELYKFRSMRTDAEKNGVAVWASKDDNRTTRVGRFIRRTRLDELPQLFNVLAGHMSFVGPRPERPQFVDQLNTAIRYYNLRHSVKPGLTGWAQLRYPYGASVKDAEEKLKFDLFYVKNQGILFDFMIMLQTVEVVLFGRGAR